MYYVPYILTETTTMYLTVPLHYAFIAFSHAQKVPISEMAIVKVSLMITEVDLAKTMQCLMRNALRRSICRSAIGQRGFQMYSRCLHCPYSLRRYRKKDGKPLRDKRDKYYYYSRIFQPNFTFQSFKYIFFCLQNKKNNDVKRRSRQNTQVIALSRLSHKNVVVFSSCAVLLPHEQF